MTVEVCCEASLAGAVERVHGEPGHSWEEAGTGPGHQEPEDAIDDIVTVDDFLAVSENHILEDVNRCCLNLQERERVW